MKQAKTLVIAAVLLIALGLFYTYNQPSQEESGPADANEAEIVQRPQKVEDYQAEVQKALSTSKSRMSSEATLAKVDALVSDLQLTLESFVIDSADQQEHLNLMLTLSQISQTVEDENLEKALEMLNTLYSDHLE